MKPVLIHTHFHNRRTGLTRSVENVLSFFEESYETFVYGYGIKGREMSFRNLIKILFSKREVVVHCHRNNEILRFLLFRLLGAKFKLIATRHAASKPSGLTQFLLKKSDKIITLTQNMSADLNLPNTLVGHGVDINQFLPKENVVLPEVLQKNLITCAGRVREAKGQKVLLAAIAPVLKQFPDWALVVVGKVDQSDFLDDLKGIVKKYNVGTQIYFLKETPQITAVYQASKLVVVPSFSEGFSLVCAEAMSCGATVVATKNVGVHSDLITDAKNGYLFEAGNTLALQKQIKELITGEKVNLGEAARKEITQNWSAQKEAASLVAVYQSFEL